jgi:hypothetical protein
VGLAVELRSKAFSARNDDFLTSEGLLDQPGKLEL